MIRFIKGVYYKLKVNIFKRKVNRKFRRFRYTVNSGNLKQIPHQVIRFGYDMEVKLLYPEISVSFYKYDEKEMLECINDANIKLIQKFGRFYIYLLDVDTICKFILMHLKNVYLINEVTDCDEACKICKGLKDINSNLDLLYYTMI